MKSIAILGLSALVAAAPGTWEDQPVKVTTTTTPADPTQTWADIPADVTVTKSAKVTYCSKSGKLTTPVDDTKYCTIDVTTIKVPASTATVTVTAGGHGGKPGDKVTVTETKTVGGKDSVTVTETKTVTSDCAKPTGGFPGHDGKCVVDDDKAKEIVANFATLLEYTSYNGTQGAPGRGYKKDVSDKTLAKDFVDISDSINFMAGFPLGSVTFKDKAAFDYGQGVLQPEVLTETLGVYHDCDSITWRWKLTPKIPGAWPVVGINYFEINKDGLVQKNYAEFNNGAWLQSFGRQCAINPVSKVDGEWAKKI